MTKHDYSRGANALAAHPNVRRTVYADGLMEVFETKDGTDITTVGAHLLAQTIAAKPADLPLSDLKT